MCNKKPGASLNLLNLPQKHCIITETDLQVSVLYPRRNTIIDTFLMKPKIDFAFKEIMTDEKARIGFLSAVLALKPEDIKETHILNSYLRKIHEDDKLGILDVRILMNDDTEIDTEIQLSKMLVWADRALFYAAKMYTDQIEQGQKCVPLQFPYPGGHIQLYLY